MTHSQLTRCRQLSDRIVPRKKFPRISEHTRAHGSQARTCRWCSLVRNRLRSIVDRSSPPCTLQRSLRPCNIVRIRNLCSLDRTVAQLRRRNVKGGVGCELSVRR